MGYVLCVDGRVRVGGIEGAGADVFVCKPCLADGIVDALARAARQSVALAWLVGDALSASTMRGDDEKVSFDCFDTIIEKVAVEYSK